MSGKENNTGAQSQQKAGGAMKVFFPALAKSRQNFRFAPVFEARNCGIQIQIHTKYKPFRPIMSQTYSFFQSVEKSFDKAAAFTKWDKGPVSYTHLTLPTKA